MVANRVIRVDDDVYLALQKKARPFEDTPNTVLRRLLHLADEPIDRSTASPQEAPSSTKQRNGHRNPQEAFRRPILEAVEELGGKAPVSTVIARVEQKMRKKLTKLDYSTVKSGLPRWQVYARWLRLRLVHEGLLRGERGFWEITDRGRTYLKDSA